MKMRMMKESLRLVMTIKVVVALRVIALRMIIMMEVGVICKTIFTKMVI